MNIFVLDFNCTRCARYHTDRHVVKMILESAQLLSGAVRYSGIDCGYKLTHVQHPCAVWTRTSLNNWFWLRKLAGELNAEWQYRFNHVRNHKSYDVVLSLPEPNIQRIGLTPFALAMPVQHRSHGSVSSYRRYYAYEKQHLFKWTKRDVPWWLQDFLE
mgnify:CR=1 FL=1